MIEAPGQPGQGWRPRLPRRTLRLKIGPYRLLGDVEVMPGTDPRTTFSRGGHLVPVTDAWIEYPVGASRCRHLPGALFVNRTLITKASTDLDPDDDAAQGAILREAGEPIDPA